MFHWSCCWYCSFQTAEKWGRKWDEGSRRARESGGPAVSCFRRCWSCRKLRLQRDGRHTYICFFSLFLLLKERGKLSSWQSSSLLCKSELFYLQVNQQWKERGQKKRRNVCRWDYHQNFLLILFLYCHACILLTVFMCSNNHFTGSSGWRRGGEGRQSAGTEWGTTWERQR